MITQQKMDTTPEFRFKKWNRHDDGRSKVSSTEDVTSADLISSCRYVNGIAYDCGIMSFDIDRAGTDAKFLDIQKGPSGKKLRVISKLVLKAIKKNYPELRQYISHVTKTRNDGLSLVIKFPPFQLADRKLADWVRGLQMRLGTMLKALGLGVDQGAYGLIRDIPNFVNRDARAYVNQRKLEKPRHIQRKDGNNNPIRNVLSELSAVVQRYKSIWDQGKKKNLSQYLYPDLRVERKLAEFYLRTEFKFTQTFHSQKEMAAAIGVTPVTLRKMLKNPALQNWLVVERATLGYIVRRVMDAKLFERAKAVIEGRADNPWMIKDASEVRDGERNNYIYRTAIILRDNSFNQFIATRIIGELCKNMEGHESSVNVRRIREIVQSIFENPRQSKKRSLSLIPGIFAAIKTQDAILGNVLSLHVGGEGSKSLRAKSQLSNFAALKSEQPAKTSKSKPSKSNSCHLTLLKNVSDHHFESLDPQPFEVGYKKKRRYEYVSNWNQKNLIKHIHDNLLGPLVDSISHESSFAYIKGKGNGKADQSRRLNASRYKHSISFDIQNYFPSIDRTILLQKLQSILPKQNAQKIIDCVSQGSHENGKIIERATGIPVGSGFSNKLANLYLTEFDNWLTSEEVDFVRYSDDYTIYGNDKAALIEKFREIQSWLWNNRKLRIKRSKTELDGKSVNEDLFVNLD